MIITSINSPTSDTIEDGQGFPKVRVDDSNVGELLLQVITQLKLVSLKLDCLQPNDDALDDNELDMEDLQ